MKCKYCGKEYKLNKNIPANASDFLKKAMQYIPDCDCENKIVEAELEKKRLQDVKKIRVDKYKKISIVDDKFYESTFNNVEETETIAKVKKYTNKILEKNNFSVGLNLYGKPGNGKTCASYCIANELMENGKTVLVMNLGKYLNKLKQGWDETESELLESVKNCEMLIVDDLGVEKITDWVLEKVFTLVDTRYRTGKGMCITTNLSMEQIREKFGDRIADRIGGMSIAIHVKEDSRRAKEAMRAFAELMA